MKRTALTLVSALAVSLAFAPAAFANESPEDFVKKASTASIFEIETSNLALERSKNQSVQDFAQRMVTDHTAASNKLKATLSAAKVNAAPATALDEKHQKKLNELQEASDADFDKKYIAIQEDAHEKAVDLFEDFAEDGKNVPLKQFAAETLPTLEQHHELVEQLKTAER